MGPLRGYGRRAQVCGREFASTDTDLRGSARFKDRRAPRTFSAGGWERWRGATWGGHFSATPPRGTTRRGVARAPDKKIRRPPTTERPRNQEKKGGARCSDAKSLHRAPRSTPDTSPISPPEGFPIHTVPDPKTLCRARTSLPSFRAQCNPKIVRGANFLWISCGLLVHNLWITYSQAAVHSLSTDG